MANKPLRSIKFPGLPDKYEIVQPDWNQNDENAPDYVKNRTHWAEPATVTVIPETTLQDMKQNGDLYCYYDLLYIAPNAIRAGKMYTVIFDGVSYDCVAFDYDGTLGLGNLSFLGGGDDSGEPFLLSGFIVGTKTGGHHTISCTTDGYIYHKLPLDYIEKGNVLDGIIVHNSKLMTTEEANSCKAKFNSNEVVLIKWSDFTIKAITSVTSNELQFETYDEKYYSIPINNDGVFSLEDATCTYISIACIEKSGYSSPILNIKRNEPIHINLSRHSSSAPKEILFYVDKNDGFSGNQRFEVLSDGTVKANSIILASSTEGSKKMFEITVDDSGTLSATEVTQ